MGLSSQLPVGSDGGQYRRQESCGSLGVHKKGVLPTLNLLVLQEVSSTMSASPEDYTAVLRQKDLEWHEEDTRIRSKCIHASCGGDCALRSFIENVELGVDDPSSRVDDA
ncbi:hypothetical protein HPB51_026463 [Rhipicephalus microplus]|uniref:Uncharacterized protein n=1 Tax=Rhipicephalus microplus TaxID=6941 RepID=A0A9J6D2Y9_RHIMP|nr:hypothetical protein HPB51_026463 [Rhipicephalus microplus]